MECVCHPVMGTLQLAGALSHLGRIFPSFLDHRHLVTNGPLTSGKAFDLSTPHQVEH